MITNIHSNIILFHLLLHQTLTVRTHLQSVVLLTLKTVVIVKLKHICGDSVDTPYGFGLQSPSIG